MKPLAGCQVANGVEVVLSVRLAPRSVPLPFSEFQELYNSAPPVRLFLVSMSPNRSIAFEQRHPATFFADWTIPEGAAPLPHKLRRQP
jgi:hypothetical protein